MAQTLVNIRIDEDVKKQMEELCKELGLTMSAAFNIFARKMIRENGIPFEVALDPIYYDNDAEYIDDVFDNETIKKLLKSEEDINEGRTKKAAIVVKELREKYGF